MKIVSPVAISLAIFALSGCASAPKPVAPPTMPITGEALTAMREAFTRFDPGAKLASVSEVLARGGFLRLTESPPADFPVGTAVAIVDSTRKPVANGEVVKSDDSGIDVKFEGNGGRPPMVGDVAVRFSDPK